MAGLWPEGLSAVTSFAINTISRRRGTQLTTRVSECEVLAPGGGRGRLHTDGQGWVDAEERSTVAGEVPAKRGVQQEAVPASNLCAEHSTQQFLIQTNFPSSWEKPVSPCKPVDCTECMGHPGARDGES